MGADMKKYDKLAYDTMVERSSNLKHPYVAGCLTCFHDATLSLFESMIGSAPKHTGNFATHLRTHQLSAKKKLPSDDASEAPSSAKKSKKGVGASASAPVGSIQVPTIQ